MKNPLCVLAVVVVLAAIGASVLYVVALWVECLTVHPWWYCLGTIHR